MECVEINRDIQNIFVLYSVGFKEIPGRYTESLILQFRIARETDPLEIQYLISPIHSKVTKQK